MGCNLGQQGIHPQEKISGERHAGILDGMLADGEQASRDSHARESTLLFPSHTQLQLSRIAGNSRTQSTSLESFCRSIAAA
jgi:hypothetical protein